MAWAGGGYFYLNSKVFYAFGFFCSANNVVWPHVLFCDSVLFRDYSRVVGPVGLPGGWAWFSHVRAMHDFADVDIDAPHNTQLYNI